MERPEFDVVAVVGSAAGVDALASILRGLPADFPAPVVVVQHLSDEGRALASIIRRRLHLPVSWASEGHKLEAGQVLLCPPASAVVVLPDGTLSVVASVQPQDRPCDMLLESLAETHADRTLAVVLVGTGRDGAVGARAVRAAGGMVVAEAAPLPTAAVAAGAVDLVLPRDEIGALLLDLVGGGLQPPAPPDEDAVRARVFVGGSEAAAILCTVDWSSTPLGPVGTWPASLAAAVRTMLDNPLPVIVHWGPELVVLPNDAARDLLGTDFARVVGQPLADAWPANVDAHLDVLETGRPRVVEDAPFLVDGRERFLTSALTV
ncbi:MAG TPA: chemotaxis protein CheB, partial [Acidimicrobiales bacterium]